jgi:hypothetical protein
MAAEMPGCYIVCHSKERTDDNKDGRYNTQMLCRLPFKGEADDRRRWPLKSPDVISSATPHWQNILLLDSRHCF